MSAPYPEVEGHTPGEWRAAVRPVGACVYSIGTREECRGGHPVYSEFIQPFGIQMHGPDFDHSHAAAKRGSPHSSSDARLISLAPTAPHLCSLPGCEGNRNRERLQAAEGLARELKDTSPHSPKAGCPCSICSVLARWEAAR